jgi:hypothetical protein
MPIEFAPPSTSLQGFQITPPQVTDPLQTLAQMGQLRTQNLQQQSAALGLEQERMKLDSSKALMDAMVKGGGDFDQTFKLASQPGSKVMPGDLIALRQHYTQMQQDTANLDKTQRENTAAGIDQYRGLLANVQNPDDLAAANAKADQMGIPKTVPRHLQFSDPTHVQAFSNGLATQAQLIKEATERETQARERAQAGLAGVQTTEAQQKVDLADRAAAIAEAQAAETDPATGTPTPAAMAQIQQRHPKVQMPAPTKEAFDRWVRTGVPVEKQPEFDINTMKAKMGLMGNSEFDQFLLKNAQALGQNRTPANLTAPEFNKILQDYAKFKQDPAMLALILGQKGLQEQLTRGQLASMPTPESNDMFARMLLNHEMSPDQLNELRSGRAAAAPQILMRAKAIDPSFNMARLEAEYKAMSKAEADFGTGSKGDLVRSNNNTIEHMGQLDMARQALGTGNIPLLRSIAQSFGLATGSDAETIYDLIAKKVGDEFTKSFIPGAGGEKERMEAAGDFRRQLGDQQISGNIKAAIHAMDAQQQNLIQQYNRATYGKGQQGANLMTPEALAVRNRLLGQTAAEHKVGDLVEYQGKLHRIKSIENGKIRLDPNPVQQ